MSTNRFQALTDEQLDRIDATCSELEDAWRRGEPASIEERCCEVDPDLRSNLLRELLAAEIEVRRSLGELPHPAEYELRFPEHVEEIGQAFGFVSDFDPTLELTQTIAYDETAQSFAGDEAGQRGALSETIALDSRHETLPKQFGRYRLLRLLGRGGMGSVYLAHDQELDRDVAIKFPEFDDRTDLKAVAIERFRREARAMATLHHPNLCPVYDVGELDGRHYLTMAYVEGRSLSACQSSGEDAIRIVGIIARALQAAHEAGIVHRDLKPSNVMLNSRGEPVIMDFGLASRDAISEAELTHSGLIIGSPAYMAPEQVNAEHDRVGPRTDVYALGVMLYQLLTGQRPFDGPGLSVLGQIAAGTKPPAPSKIADVTPCLEAICLKAMAHRMEDRYQSTAELASDLEACDCLEESASTSRRSVRLVGAGLLAAAAIVSVILLQSADDTERDASLPASPDSVQGDTSRGSVGTDTVSVAPEADTLTNAWGDPELFASPLNGPNTDGSPTFSADGQAVVFHRPIPDSGHYHLWATSRLSPHSEFARPQRMLPTVNSAMTNTNPRLSADGLTLVFDSDRAGGNGGLDLWYSRRESIDSPWRDAQHFGPQVNSRNRDSCPCLSEDGLTLLFASDREDGFGGDDLWISSRTSPDDEFGPPENVGANVNTAGPESHPWLSADGLTLMFSAVRAEGYGGFDLWFSTRPNRSSVFGPPINAGPQINSAEQEGHGSLSPDGGVLYFESTRIGGLGGYDIWMARRHGANTSAAREFVDSGQELGNGSSRAVRLGDLDDDGDLDAFVVNRHSESNRVWFNNGNGTFRGSGQLLGQSYSWDLALGDVDHDGDLDAVVVNGQGQDSLVWLNDGAGQFAASEHVIPSQNGRAIGLADFDEDGDLDVMLGDSGANRLWLNDGTGRFTDSGQLLGDSDTFGLAVGDINGDGTLDAFAGNGGGQSEQSDRVWLNDGAGMFSESGQTLDPIHTMSVALADLNGDGNLDAFCVNDEKQPNTLWLNDGHGHFLRRDQYDKRLCVSVTIGDVDSDGDADAFVTNSNDAPNQILLNDGEAGFAPTAIQWIGESTSSGAAFGDLDGDGDLDVFVTNFRGQPNRVWLNRRRIADRALVIPDAVPPHSARPTTNPFADTGQNLGNSSAYAVAAGDIDGDGDVDMLVANSAADQPDQIWLNNSHGQFEAGQELEGIHSSDVEFGDLDNDGDLDAFVACRGTPCVIWRNDGTGQFEKFGETESLMTQSLALGDVDGDGDLDVIIGCCGDTPSNRVLINDGSGQFEDDGQRLGNSNTLGVALADLDGDDDLDAFAANWTGGNTVWWNKGDGTFTDRGERLGKGQYVHVALADVDHDGDIDACATSPTEALRLWINDGTGNFSVLELGRSVTPSLGVAIADFSGDGRNDIVIGNGDLTNGHPMFPNQIFVSNEERSWDSHWYGAEATADFGVSDLDGDGDVDAFLANGFGRPNRVWLSQGLEESVPSGPVHFRDSGQRLGSAFSNEVALGDIDNDGDLDAVVANTNGEGSVVWLNNGAGQFIIGMRMPEPQRAYDVGLGDVDGDEDLDVFLTSKDGPNRIWLNDSLGVCEMSPQRIGDSSSNQVGLADFDHDGDLDAWVGNFNPDNDRLLINDGSGMFEVTDQLLGPERNYSVHPVDVDGDGDIDVLTATGVSHVNSLWLNDGHAKFTRSDEVLSGSLPSNGFVSGDLNGDGFPDLYESGWVNPDRIWLNDGDGRFTQTEQIGQRLRSRRTQLADLDNDGDLDVFVGNEVHLPNVICLNDGHGRFSDPVQCLGSSTTSSVALGDLDGDGDIDAFTVNSTGQPNRVWLNDLLTQRR